MGKWIDTEKPQPSIFELTFFMKRIFSMFQQAIKFNFLEVASFQSSYWFVIYIFGKLAPSFEINVSNFALNHFLVHSNELNISNDVKHIVDFLLLFNWYHKMVSHQNGDIRGGPPSPPLATPLLIHNLKVTMKSNLMFFY